MEPRNRFRGMDSASLCSMAGRYDNPLPPWCLAPIDSIKIPAPGTPKRFQLVTTLCVFFGIPLSAPGLFHANDVPVQCSEHSCSTVPVLTVYYSRHPLCPMFLLIMYILLYSLLVWCCRKADPETKCMAQPVFL